MRVRFYRLIVAVLLMVVACGQDQVETPPNPPSTTLKTVQVMLFSAPWCTECPSELTGMQSLLAGADENTRSHIKTKMFVVTGPNKEKPTQEMADAYRDSLGVSFETVADEWRWKTYRTYIKKTWNLPAVVVLDDSGNLLKIYVAPPKYAPEEVFDFVNESIRSSR